ncbi:MAG: hypothetical protein WBD51_02700, partial [Burkholderiaceae bacterium]
VDGLGQRQRFTLDSQLYFAILSNLLRVTERERFKQFGGYLVTKSLHLPIFGPTNFDRPLGLVELDTIALPRSS